MKKIYAVLPVLLLSGCALSQNDGISEEMAYEETGLPIEEGYIDESYSETTYATDNTPEQPSQARQEYQPTNGQPVLSADGTVIEIPAQQIYIGDVMAAAPTGYPATAVQHPTALSYSEPIQAQQRAPRVAQPAVITLQNREYPNTYAQCMSTDTECITSYELQGYIRVRNLPQFAGYQEVLAPSDYPKGGRWRNKNNIPRW